MTPGLVEPAAGGVHEALGMVEGRRPRLAQQRAQALVELAPVRKPRERILHGEAAVTLRLAARLLESALGRQGASPALRLFTLEPLLDGTRAAKAPERFVQLTEPLM